MTPIFIASYGRSGSTLLMRALAAHHKIAARAVFPYETRMAQHLFLCYREGMRFPPFTPVKFQHSEYRAWIDSDAPSVQWAEYHRKAEIGECGLRLAREYYRFVAELQNQSEPEYFARNCTL